MDPQVERILGLHETGVFAECFDGSVVGISTHGDI
jgi:hypothetical protein